MKTKLSEIEQKRAKIAVRRAVTALLAFDYNVSSSELYNQMINVCRRLSIDFDFCHTLKLVSAIESSEDVTIKPLRRLATKNRIELFVEDLAIANVKRFRDRIEKEEYEN
jgi:hypothetical protein